MKDLLRRPGWNRIVLLLLAGALSESLYLILARFEATNGNPVFWFLLIFAGLFLLYALAAQICTGLSPSEGEGARDTSLSPSGAGRRLFALVILFGLAFRLTLVPAGLRGDLPFGEALRDDLKGDAVTFDSFLLYDQDVWRYLWEGHVWASGFNPYSQAPNAPSLDSITELNSVRDDVWSEIRDRVSYPDIAALYPPLAQFLFRLSHATFPASITGLKLWLIALECLSGLLLFLALRKMRRPPLPALTLFAWNPLLVKSFAGSAHFDVLVVLALSLLIYALAAGRRYLAHAALGLAALGKFVPLVLLPLLAPFLWSGLAVTGVVLLAGYLPFFSGLAVGGLFSTGTTFAAHWRFNSAPFRFTESLTGTATALLLYSVLILAVIILFRKSRHQSLEDKLRRMLWLLGLTIVLSPVVHPWYVTWLLPLACFLRDRVWLAYSGLVFFAFLVMFDAVERPWIVSLEYLGLLSVALFNHPFGEEISSEKKPETAVSLS